MEDRRTGDRRLAIIILAAGKGTRMKTERPKVLLELGGLPIIEHVVRLAQTVGPERIIVVVGHQASAVRASLQGYPLEFVYQDEQLGTAHAVRQTYPSLRDFLGDIIVLCGDVPLLSSGSLKMLIQIHRQRKAVLSFLTTELEDPQGYGRVIRDEEGRVKGVIEEREANEEVRAIREINGGIYCFQREFLYPALDLVKPDNRQGEYYLTDLIEIAYGKGLTVEAIRIDSPQELLGINTLEELDQMRSFLQEARDEGLDLSRR